MDSARHLMIGEFPFTPEFFHALLADAGAVAEIFRHTREEFAGNFHARAPARAFVSGGRTKLALIRAAAQRALVWIMKIREVHGKSARTR
jgi:hypothetical protein